MTQNFLFMFEFVVDDVLVVKPNRCAPEEYPTCCEVSFRNNVFVSICDHEYNQCSDPCKPKCGKICVFSLESPITEADKLHIHIYKKKTEQCKFLIGCTDLPIKTLFDRVMENFNIENPDWQNAIARHINTLPGHKEQKNGDLVNRVCDSDEEGRREQLCPASELTKHLMPIFNFKRVQTGNVVLLVRLVAVGPTIVTTFPYSRICNAGCEKRRNCKSEHKGFNKKCCTPNESCRPDFDDCKSEHKGSSKKCCAANKSCRSDFDDCKSEHKGSNKKCCAPIESCRPDCDDHHNYKSNNACTMKDPCHKELKTVAYQRYFACNADKGCPFDTIEDECARAAKCKAQKEHMKCPPQDHSSSYSCEEYIEECEAVEESCKSLRATAGDPFQCEPCSADTCDDCVQDPYNPCGQCMQPCFQAPRPPNPGPEAYDEFEACLNGSGLVIRVLKDTHQMENIYDGVDELSDTKCNKYSEKENSIKGDSSFSNFLQSTNFARNHIKRRTGGHIINHPNLPKIRANIKYSGNEKCPVEKYNVSYSKIKACCDNRRNKIDNYRSYRARRCNLNESEIKYRKDEKNCCVQVDQQDIKNVMKGLDVDTRKKGIEVCYKTCEETDSDVFLVKLGSKQKSKYKKNNIEIELKTPKVPLNMVKQHVTTETQINETELDAALANICNVKKGRKSRKKKK